MPDAFYVPDGDAFVATVHTRGPWSATHQHGGPPAALLARALEAQAPGFVIARITVDFLLPVPIDRLAVRVETLRAGSKVQRLLARLLHGERVMAQALAALVRPGAVAIASPANDPALPPPEHGRPFQFPFFHEPVSYHEAMETRLVRGDWGSGRVAAWMRPRAPEHRGGGAVFVRQIAVLPSRSPRARYGRSFGPPHLTDRMRSGSEPWR